MSGRLLHELEYHYSDGAFSDGPDANITIHYYRKMNRFAKYKLANNSIFTVYKYLTLPMYLIVLIVCNVISIISLFRSFDFHLFSICILSYLYTVVNKDELGYFSKCLQVQWNLSN